MKDVGSTILEFARSYGLLSKAFMQVEVVASLVRRDSSEVRGVRAGTAAIWILVDGLGFECRPGGSDAAVAENV